MMETKKELKRELKPELIEKKQKQIWVQKKEKGKIIKTYFTPDMWKRIKELADNKWELIK